MRSWDGWRAKCNDSGVVLTARIILFGLVLAQLTDALTFTIGVSRFGIGPESNGFASTLFQSGGLASVLVVKGGVLIATIAIVVLIGIGIFGGSINSWFQTLAGRITTTGT